MDVSSAYLFEKASLTDKQVPAWIIRAHDRPPGPLILAQHGLLGSKDTMLEQTLQLAANGFVVVSCDAVDHGERSDPLLIATLIQNAPERIAQILLDTANDLCEVITVMLEREEVSGSSVGIMGVSMGGFISFLAAMQDSRIDVVATALAGGNFDILLKKSLITQMMGLNIERADTSEIAKLIQNNDPYHHPERLADKAVLLVYATGDPLVPAESPESLHEQLLPFFSDQSDRLHLRPYESNLHAFTTPMMTEITEWFKRYLINPSTK